MSKTGSMLIPVIISVILLIVDHNFASEIVFYSLPLQKADNNLNEQLSRKIPNRQWISLNGEWEIIDPKSNNRIGKINVPFGFLSGDEILLQKEFEFSKASDLQLFFSAEWINGWSQIEINNRILFSGSRNYLPFKFEISQTFLKPGQNIVQIKLKPYNGNDNQIPSWTPINLPQVSSGILGSVYLEIVPTIHISSVKVNPQISDSLVHLSGEITLSQPFNTIGNCKISIKYQNSQKVLHEEKIQVLDSLSNKIDIPEWETDQMPPWSVNAPGKYWIEIEIDSAGKVFDRFKQPIALRSGKVDGNKFILDDKILPIKGINYVYQTPDGMELFDPELIQRDLHFIKEKGFNAVRVILHPLPEQFYQLCDELGLLCFQDLPFIYTNLDDSQIPDWESYYEYYEQLALRHSSIIAGGIAYQIDDESSQQSKKLNQFINRMGKPTTLSYVTTLDPGMGLYKNVDFQIVEIVHRNAIEKEMMKLEEKFAGYAFFPSAFSKPMSYRVDSTTITSDLIQIKSLYQITNRELNHGRLPGQFILTYNDYYLNFPSLQNGFQNNLQICQTGLVDLNRQQRLFYDEESSDKANTFQAPMISEAKSAKSYIYIILGISNLFLFLYSYRRFTEFRHNVNYSLKKAHGFFVNLQERIIIPYGQSLLIIFVVSLNGAIIWDSFSFYFRNNLILDYILSLFFFTPKTKRLISNLIWDQQLFLVVVTILHFIIFYGLALLIKLLSLFGKSRVAFRQSVAVCAWSAVPFLFLLPFGIILYNMLLSLNSYWIIIVVLLYFHVWVYLRWINGTRVLTERRYFRIFIFFTFLGVMISAIILFFYQYQINLFDHLRIVYYLYR